MLFLAVTGYLSDFEQVQLTTLNPKSPHLPHRAGVRADHLNVFVLRARVEQMWAFRGHKWN